MYLLKVVLAICFVVISAREYNKLDPVNDNHPLIQLNNQKGSPFETYMSSSDKGDISWTKINEQVDLVIPLVLKHILTAGVEYLRLPEIKETITINPLLISSEAGLYLSDGIVYNIAGIKRFGDSYMTYENKSFICNFKLIIKALQFEYKFLLKLMGLEGFGKAIGSLEDTIVSAELAINAKNTTIMLHDFRIVKFRNISVQIDTVGVIRQITGLILSPITNLFRERITTSMSDGLKEQMQLLMDDFNGADPLELQTFTKQMLSGLTGN